MSFIKSDISIKNRWTQLVRFDACPDDPYNPTSTPIYQTATFAQHSIDEFGRYDYTRSGNPTRTVLETQLANKFSSSLENKQKNG